MHFQVPEEALLHLVVLSCREYPGRFSQVSWLYSSEEELLKKKSMILELWLASLPALIGNLNIGGTILQEISSRQYYGLHEQMGKSYFENRDNVRY